jgi:AcrR family transcriptional regulator
VSQHTAYHHGDLRRALLDAAVGLIEERGIAAVSLRELARRAGVSHAAPAHHFTDKAGLFTAVAVEGHRLLADSFTAETWTEHRGSGADPQAADDPPRRPEGPVPPILLRELGVRYVRFALDHPAHFDVMFRPDLVRPDDPDLRAARTRTTALLENAVPGGLHEPRRRRVGLAAWSAAHGFAVLWRESALASSMGHDDPEAGFREVADTMFGDAPADPARGA